ncbi:MAG: hypothetical protein JWN57_1064, partial [Frankiales bacterium]|nr:hypothetical protein [Frankiales bacterium]
MAKSLPTTSKALAKRLEREALISAQLADQEQRRHAKALARREHALRRARR